VRLRTRLRVAFTVMAATAAGLLHAARHRGDRQRISLGPGDAAPDFVLEASDGRRYRLHDLRGRVVVLAWFPKAFTGGCTVECKSIAASRRQLEQQGAAVFGMSVDTPDTNREFASTMGLDLPILSDPDASVARAYGVLGASGFPSRWTFYIGRDGRIFAIDKNVQVSTHGTDIENALKGTSPGSDS
jgi:thioredoxin-dependent peroxiredoxin